MRASKRLEDFLPSAQKGPRKPKQRMTALERAIWLLMQTDDYDVQFESPTQAVLVYIHDGSLVTLNVDVTEPAEVTS